MTLEEAVFDRDAAHRYTLRLRGKPAEMNEPGWSVDWSDAPWPFKIYEGGERVALPGCVPTWLGAQRCPTWSALGRILQLSVGCLRTRVRPSVAVSSAAVRVEAAANRAVASGGALYPSEVYVCGADALQCSAYHYDAARHELVAVRAERVAQTLAAALGEATLADRVGFVVTNYFWKNFCKYGDFGYRLSAVDIGVAASRLQRVVQAELGNASLHVDFDDRALNALLCLDDQDESAYAVILAHKVGGKPLAPRPDPSFDSCAYPRQKSRTIKRSAAYAAMHESAMNAADRAAPRTPQPQRPWEVVLEAHAEAPLSQLPCVPPLRNLERAIVSRASDGPRFVFRRVSIEMVALVLSEAAVAMQRVAGEDHERDYPSVQLALVVQGVQGLVSGAYLRNPKSGALLRVRSAELGLELQASSNLQNINLDLAAFTVHWVGEVDLRRSVRGNRTYRIQQLVVGAGLDAAALACADQGLSAHPMLGFVAAKLDALYGLADSGFGVLAQAAVGTPRSGGHLQGAVYP